ncbi:MAG: efflux RND transporter periplasmic adaptor subunit [Phycisphaerae bacterium]|jgi:HlyD family secretion protein
MRSFLVLLVLVGLSVGSYYGYRAFSRAEPPARYRTEAVRRATVVSTVTATGFVEPLIKVLVGSQVSGTVTRWYFDFNAEVRAGDVLAELDQDRIKATISQREASVAVARAGVEQAEARLTQTALDLERITNAHKRQAASDTELESARATNQEALAALHAAQAQVKEAEAQLQFSQIELEKTIIRAPIDGVVISRDVDAGQTVAASLQAPTLFTIANDLRKMRVNAAVSETDIGNIREGMTAEFRVDAFPEQRFRGVVSQVRFAETVQNNVVTYQTMIDVDNPDLLLRPGMTATIQFEVNKAADVLVVPNAALRFDPSVQPVQVDFRPQRGQAPRSRVFKLAAGELVEVPVQTGITDGVVTQIIGGELAEGDAVVVDWDYNARRASSGGTPRMPRGF